jgi:hypothetical protein
MVGLLLYLAWEAFGLAAVWCIIDSAARMLLMTAISTCGMYAYLKLLDQGTPWQALKNDDGTPYLTRWCLFCTPFGRLYLHHIPSADYARELHNHPADWVCFVLWGGYVQRRMQQLFHQYHGAHGNRLRVPIMNYKGEHATTGESSQNIARWSTNRMTTDVYHRIAHVEPNTWTLCWFGAKAPGEWGFWVNGKHMPFSTWRTWRTAKGAPDVA